MSAVEEAPAGRMIADVDLFAFVDLLRRRWLLASGTALAIVAAAVAVALLATPVYRAEVLLAPVETGPGAAPSSLFDQLGSIASIAGVGSAQSGSVDESIAVFQSRGFTEDYIVENDLLPVLFDGLWDAEAGKWVVDDGADEPSPYDGYLLFQEKIRSLKLDPVTGLVRLSFDWKDRELAQRWATESVERLNEKMQERAIRQSTRKLEYLNSELAKSSAVELRQSIYRLIEAEIGNMMLASVNKEYAFRVLDPALLPDEDYPVWPKRRVLIGAGILGGAFVGIIMALLVDFLARFRARRRQA